MMNQNDLILTMGSESLRAREVCHVRALRDPAWLWSGPQLLLPLTFSITVCAVSAISAARLFPLQLWYLLASIPFLLAGITSLVQVVIQRVTRGSARRELKKVATSVPRESTSHHRIKCAGEPVELNDLIAGETLHNAQGYMQVSVATRFLRLAYPGVAVALLARYIDEPAAYYGAAMYFGGVLGLAFLGYVCVSWEASIRDKTLYVRPIGLCNRLWANTWQVELRAAHIICDFSAGTFLIKDENGTVRRIRMSSAGYPHAFARTLIQTAISCSTKNGGTEPVE